MTREDYMADALRQARDLFQIYGDLHMSKDPPQRDKALRIYGMVATINNALLAEDDLMPMRVVSE